MQKRIQPAMAKFSLRQFLIWTAIIGCLLAAVQAVIWPRTGLLDAAVYAVMDRTGNLREMQNSEGENVLGAPNSKGLLDAAIFALVACGLGWWLYRRTLSRLRTSSSKLWFVSFVLYVLVDSFYLLMSFLAIARPGAFHWGGNFFVMALFGTLASLFATVVGTTMAIAWLVQSVVRRLRAIESDEYGSKEWIARALVLVGLGIPCVLSTFVFVFIVLQPMDPTH